MCAHRGIKDRRIPAELPPLQAQKHSGRKACKEAVSGRRQKPANSPARAERGRTFSFSAIEKASAGTETKGLGFIAYPTIQFFDGRMANRPFLQEMPDPVTQITWAGWVEINPETARKLNVEKGDLLTIRSEHGTVSGTAFPYSGITPDTLAMPVGHGHTAFGRYARSETTNPFHLASGRLDVAGGIVWASASVTLQKQGRVVSIANTDGSAYQHGRDLVRSISLERYRSTLGQTPEVTLPLPQGWDKRDRLLSASPARRLSLGNDRRSRSLHRLRRLCHRLLHRK